MKFIKSTITSFISNMFGVFISLLTIIITARILGPGGNGIWNVATVFIGLSVIVLGLGIPFSNVFFIGKDREDINSVLGMNFIVTLISSFGIIIVYFINMKFHFRFFSSLEGWTLILVFITIPFMILKTSLYNVFLGIEEVTKFNKITMMDKLITFVFLTIFIITFRSAQWAIVSTFVSTIIMISYVSYILFIKKGYRLAINKRIITGMFRYGFKAVMGNLIQNINYRLDVLITATYLTPVAVGLYGKATQLGETMWRVSGSVGTVVFPFTANSKDKQAMTIFINKVIRVTFTFIVFCSLCLTIISKPLIVFVLGKKFLGSVTPFMLIIPGICVFSVNNILGSYFAGLGLIGKNIIASSISGVITIALDLILIPRIGINGASITSSISYIVCTGISLYFYIKVTGSRLSDILIIKKSDLIEIKLRLYRLRKVKGA
jgi:stage V sporulation protein B